MSFCCWCWTAAVLHLNISMKFAILHQLKWLPIYDYVALVQVLTVSATDKIVVYCCACNALQMWNPVMLHLHIHALTCKGWLRMMSVLLLPPPHMRCISMISNHKFVTCARSRVPYDLILKSSHGLNWCIKIFICHPVTKNCYSACSSHKHPHFAFVQEERFKCCCYFIFLPATFCSPGDSLDRTCMRKI